MPESHYTMPEWLRPPDPCWYSRDWAGAPDELQIPRPDGQRFTPIRGSLI